MFWCWFWFFILFQFSGNSFSFVVVLKILTSNVFYDFILHLRQYFSRHLLNWSTNQKHSSQKNRLRVYFGRFSNFSIELRIQNIFPVFCLNLHSNIPLVKQTAMFLLESWMQHNIWESINKHFNLTNMHLRINFFCAFAFRLMLLNENTIRGYLANACDITDAHVAISLIWTSHTWF